MTPLFFADRDGWRSALRGVLQPILAFSLMAAALLALPTHAQTVSPSLRNLHSQLEAKLDELQQTQAQGQTNASKRTVLQERIADYQSQQAKGQADLKRYNEMDVADPGSVNPQRMQTARDQIIKARGDLATAQRELASLQSTLDNTGAQTRIKSEIDRLRSRYERELNQQAEQTVSSQIAQWRKETREVRGVGEIGCNAAPSQCEEQAKQAAMRQASESGSRIFVSSLFESRISDSSNSQGQKASSSYASSNTQNRVSAELTNVKEISSGFKGKSTYVYELTATATPSVDAAMRVEMVQSQWRDIEAALGGEIKYPANLQQAEPPAQASRATSSPSSANLNGASLIANRYQVLGDGSEIKDTQINLIWQRCSVGQNWTGRTCEGKAKTLTFEAAQKLTGQGWRLPTVRELFSLVDCPGPPQKPRPVDSGITQARKDGIKIDGKAIEESLSRYCGNPEDSYYIQADAFPNSRRWYWTGSPLVGYESRAWAVNFHGGNVVRASLGDVNSVRLVRVVGVSD